MRKRPPVYTDVDTPRHAANKLLLMDMADKVGIPEAQRRIAEAVRKFGTQRHADAKFWKHLPLRPANPGSFIHALDRYARQVGPEAAAFSLVEEARRMLGFWQQDDERREADENRRKARLKRIVPKRKGVGRAN